MFPESSEEPAGDVLDDPEVRGQEEGGDNEAGDEGGREGPTEQIQSQRRELDNRYMYDHGTYIRW